MVEVLMSIAIIGIGLASVLPVFFYAQASVRDTELRDRATFIMADIMDEMEDYSFEELGSDALNSQNNPTLIRDGERILHYRVGEDLAFPRMDVIDSPTPEERIMLAQRIFEVQVWVYYNKEQNPNRKFLRIRLSYVPNLKPLRSGSSSGINEQVIERFISKTQVTVPDEF